MMDESTIHLLCGSVAGLLIGSWLRRLHRRRQLRADAAAATGTSIPELVQRLTDPDSPPLNDAQAARLRPLLLHWLSLRTDLNAAQIAEQVPHALRQRWFTLDLQHLSDNSDAHAAMAFACLRVAFYLRGATLLGWLDDASSSQIMHLNARRARECFDSWPAFAHAYTQGHAHWQTSGRTDVFGDDIDPESLRTWL